MKQLIATTIALLMGLGLATITSAVSENKENATYVNLEDFISDEMERKAVVKAEAELKFNTNDVEYVPGYDHFIIIDGELHEAVISESDKVVFSKKEE